MRPIDADKLLVRYKERCAGCKETKNYCEHCCDIADVIDDIEDAPTADVVKRKHGKWNWVSFNIECSECGAMPDFDSTEPLYNFCPNCGADMRGDGNDN